MNKVDEVAVVTEQDKARQSGGRRIKSKARMIKRSILARRTNQYGNISVSDKKDEDDRIVHVRGERLSVTCKANGIDCRRCVDGFNKYRGAYYPVYNGVYVAAIDLDRINAAVAARKVRAEATASAKALRAVRQRAATLARFEQEYVPATSALPDVCNAMFELNHHCKYVSCDRYDRNDIYGLKNQLVAYLYMNGYCVGAVNHVQEREKQTCYRCHGFGCYRCDDSGVYRPASTYTYVAFRFVVEGQPYSWHQPSELVGFQYQVTTTDAPMPDITAKPLTIDTKQLPQAKALVRWFLDKVQASKQPQLIPQQTETASGGVAQVSVLAEKVGTN